MGASTSRAAAQATTTRPGPITQRHLSSRPAATQDFTRRWGSAPPRHIASLLSRTQAPPALRLSTT
jgi:hypothetical protein